VIIAPTDAKMSWVKMEEDEIKELIGKLSSKESAEEAIPALVEIGQPAIEPLIECMEKDIATGMDAEMGSRSYHAAVALSKIGQPAVEPLLKALPSTRWAHFALGLIGGEEAFQTLLEELRTGNWRRIQAAARALGEIGNDRALPALKQLTGTSSWEVHTAVTEAIGRIERKKIGEKWLEVDRRDPLGQVKRVWSQFDEIRANDSLREKAIAWHRDFVAAMPSLPFPSDRERGDVWAMLGTLIYYFKNPETSSIYKECEEAAYCYEQCLRYTPERYDIQSHLKSVKPKT